MFKIETSGGVLAGVAVDSLNPPVYAAGALVPVSLDLNGRVFTTSPRPAPADGPVFTIAAGQTISNDVEPQAGFPRAGVWTIFDDPTRLAAETITIQVSSVAAPAAGDWRLFGSTVMTATLNIAVQPTAGVFSVRRMRLVSAVAVGAPGRSFVTLFT